MIEGWDVSVDPLYGEECEGGHDVSPGSTFDEEAIVGVCGCSLDCDGCRLMLLLLMLRVRVGVWCQTSRGDINVVCGLE